MQREIKFRYRCKYLKAPYAISTEIFTLEQVENGDAKRAFGKNWELLSRDEFTGLHDKNGKEIYEGDIVEWKDEFITDGNVLVAKVCYYGDGFYPDSETGGFFGPEGPEFVWEDLRVIGNIYENPELIK